MKYKLLYGVAGIGMMVWAAMIEDKSKTDFPAQLSFGGLILILASVGFVLLVPLKRNVRQAKTAATVSQATAKSFKATPPPQPNFGGGSQQVKAAFIFQGARIGRGKDMSADQAAFERIFDALERSYGKGIFTPRQNGNIDVDLNPETNRFHLKLSIQLPKDKVAEFNQAAIRELNYTGLKTS